MTEIENTEADAKPLPEEPAHLKDFGAPLKQAREAAGYSIADVSDQLKLSSDLLLALESSQLDKLPAATFTQGYLRNYARLLKLPADDIVQAYNRLVPASEPDLTPTSGLPAQRSSHDGIVKITSYGLLVIGLLLLALWWQQADFEWARPTSEQPVPQAIDEQPEAMQGEALREAMGEAPAQDEAVVAEPAGEQVPDSEPAAADSAAAEAPAEPEAEQSAVVESPSTRTDDKAAMATAAQPAAATTKRVTVGTSGKDELVISTGSESWTEIQGVDGQRLLFKLLKQGEDYHIKGSAPFRIFLGNAPSVKMQINGKPVDISAYIRGNNIANFVVNGDASLSVSREVSKPESTSSPQQQAPVTPPAPTDSSRDLMFDDGR